MKAVNLMLQRILIGSEKQLAVHKAQAVMSA
jgi:hypothetical protein